jgi:hypothetical protein
MSYEHEQRLQRLAKFTEDGNKTLQSVSKEQGMRFYTYIQNAENVVLEWRYDVIIDSGNVSLVLNINSFTEKPMNLFSFMD